MTVIPLAKLRSAAAYKPQGYYDACLAAGTVEGENLILSDEAFADLRRRFTPPNIFRQSVSAASAAAGECGAAMAGMPPVEDAEIARRLSLCEACPFLIAGERRCSKCGCFVEAKARFRTQRCPDARW